MRSLTAKKTANLTDAGGQRRTVLITVNLPRGTAVKAGWSGWPSGLVPWRRLLSPCPGPPRAM